MFYNMRGHSLKLNYYKLASPSLHGGTYSLVENRYGNNNATDASFMQVLVFDECLLILIAEHVRLLDETAYLLSMLRVHVNQDFALYVFKPPYQL